jgi:toxin ParE1/3/4
LSGFLVLTSASLRIEEIYRYSLDQWGEDQAKIYLKGLFDAFDKIESHGVISKPIPAEFGVDGFYFRYEKHFVYWKRLSSGKIGIVSVLHERMHRIGRLKKEFDF